MPSLLPGYVYDIFISYRHNDNLDGWVTQFVENLEKELRGTLKESLTIYFDKNPHDGLKQHHEVDDSLKEKLKSLILIPIVSQTYCDPSSFAWEHELIPFIKQATEDNLGLKTKVTGGNIASRVLPVKIHDIDNSDKRLFEEATGSVMRSLDFIYKESGVNRPLRPKDDRDRNQEQIDYRNQVNKVANAIKEIVAGLKGKEQHTDKKDSAPEIKVTGAPVAVKGRNWRLRMPAMNKKPVIILLSSVLLLALFILATIHLTESPPKSSTYRATILAPEETLFDSNSGGNLALSPDGNSLAFTAVDSLGISRLWVRPLNALVARVLNGTDNAFLPFWSPDSRFIGFFADGKLKKIEVSGGPPQTLCDANQGRGGAWNTDGIIIFSPGLFTPLSYVSSAGGLAMPLTKLDSLDKSTASHRWPKFLPDGKNYLYLNFGKQAICLASLDSTVAPRVVVPIKSNVDFANGHILYVRERVLMAQPFDSKLLETSGEAFPLAEDLLFEIIMRRGAFTVSQNGILVYQNGGVSTSGSKLVWHDRSGNRLGGFSHSAPFYPNFRISPEGTRIAIAHSAKNGNIDNWLYETDRNIWTRFNFDDANDRSPVWSPDGKTIVFTSSRNGDGTADLFKKDIGGAGRAELLLQTMERKEPTDWSRDGKFILYETSSSQGHDIWVLPTTSTGKGKDPKPFIFRQTNFNESNAAFSPNGQWVAYQSNESGKSEIYIQPFPGPGDIRQVSTAGGTRPHWRGDGKELFFMGPNSEIMSAEIKPGTATLDIGSVKSLFTLPYGYVDLSINNDIYQVTADGEGELFLIESFPGRNGSMVTLVVNWPEGLKKK